MNSAQPLQQLSNEEIEQFSKLFLQTENHNDSLTQEQAKQTLTDLFKDSQKYLEIVIAIITAESSKAINEATRKAAVTFTQQLLQLEQSNGDAPLDKIISQTFAIYKALVSENVPHAAKRSLGNLLVVSDSLKRHNELETTLPISILQTLNSENDSEAVGALIALKQIMCNKMLAKVLADEVKFQTLITGLARWVNRWVNSANQEFIKAKEAFAKSPESLDSQVLAKLIEKLEPLSQWTETFHAIIETGSKTIFKQMFEKESFIKTLVLILALTAELGKQNIECFVSTTGIEPLDSLLNAIKVRTLGALNKLAEFVFKNKREMKSTASYSSLESILHSSAAAMVHLCNRDVFEHFRTIHWTERLIVEIFSFMTIFAQEGTYYNFFQEGKQSLLMDVIIHCLQTSEFEKQLMIDNPVLFIVLPKDLCLNQSEDTLKSKCAKFLKSLCDNIDGMISYVTVTTNCLLQYSLLSNNISIIPEQYLLLQSYMDSWIIQKATLQTRVETCLTILSILTYAIRKRPDLLAILEITIGEFQKYFFETEDDLLKFRFIHLVSQYYDLLFKETQKKGDFEQLTFGILRAVVSVGKEKDVISLEAIDALNDIFDEYYKRLRPYGEKIFEQLIGFVKDIPHPQLFEMIGTFVRKFGTNKPAYHKLTLSLIKALVERIVTELIALEQKGAKLENNNIISHISDIIKALANEKMFSLKHHQTFAENLAPLFKYLGHKEQNNFGGSLLETLSSIMEHSHKVAHPIMAIIKLLPDLFEGNKQKMGLLFKFMNQLLAYGQEKIKNMPEALDLFIKYACGIINVAIKEADQAEGALILQIILQYYGAMLTKEQTRFILKSTLNALHANPKKSFCCAKLYGVFLNGFMENYPLTETFLVSENQSSKLLRSMFASLRDFETHYDQQVFVMGFCSVIRQEKLHPDISQFYLKIFKSVVTILKVIQAAQAPISVSKKVTTITDGNEEDERREKLLDNQDNKKKMLKKKLKKFWEMSDDEDMVEEKEGKKANAKDVKCSDDEKGEEGSEESSDSENEEDEEEDQITQSVDSLTTDVKNRDEFDTFRSALYKFKANNADALAQLTAQLSAKRLDYLRDILMTHRVIIDEEGKKQVRIRKMLATKDVKDPAHFIDWE